MLSHPQVYVKVLSVVPDEKASAWRAFISQQPLYLPLGFEMVQDAKVEHTRASAAAKENRRSSATTSGAAADTGVGGESGLWR